MWTILRGCYRNYPQNRRRLRRSLIHSGAYRLLPFLHEIDGAKSEPQDAFLLTVRSHCEGRACIFTVRLCLQRAAPVMLLDPGPSLDRDLNPHPAPSAAPVVPPSSEMKTFSQHTNQRVAGVAPQKTEF